MVVTVTGSTTNGQKLTDEESTIVSDACDMALELDAAKRKVCVLYKLIKMILHTLIFIYKLQILEYVESRMTLIAPNLSAIVGSTTAAKMLGQAGGLMALCKLPSFNFLV